MKIAGHLLPPLPHRYSRCWKTVNSQERQKCFNSTVLYYSNEGAGVKREETEIDKAHIYEII